MHSSDIHPTTFRELRTAPPEIGVEALARILLGKGLIAEEELREALRQARLERAAQEDEGLSDFEMGP